MRTRQSPIRRCLLAAVVLCLLRLAVAAERAALLDLMKHDPADKVDLKEAGDGVYEWSLPTGDAQTVRIDLAKLGIKPQEFDELRFDIQPLGSQVGLHTTLGGFPTEKDVSSWYLKFKAVGGQWASGRYDLRVDDDGFTTRWKGAPNVLELRLYRRIVGFPGEPKWRKALIRRPRFVRRIVSADFDLLETELTQDAGEVTATYRLRVENRTDQPQKAKLEADSTHALKWFRAEAPAEVALAPREKKVMPIRIVIPRATAMRLPPLYAEPAVPRVSIEGVADSDAVPLMGYRPWPMWGVVPVFNPVRWTPATFQAFLDARGKALPGVAEWRARILRDAAAAAKLDWPVPPLELLPAGFDQSYRCNECRDWLRPAEHASFRKHVCPKCKRAVEGKEGIDRAFVARYIGQAFGAVRTLTLGWLLSGDDAYAKKAGGIVAAFADGIPRVKPAGPRSTSGGARLVHSTLHTSYKLPSLAEAWAFLAEATCIGEAERAKIARFLNDEAARVARHSVEYSNQSAEHFRAYGSVGLATGFWPLAAEAVWGEFGFHELVEFAYTEEGIGHEAGAYHRAVFGAMAEFAEFAHGQGVNLLTPRFKRVFDGSLVTMGGSEVSYELAYRVYRDPAYLAALERERQHPREGTVLRGILGIPRASEMPVRSVLFPGTGYVFLRTGNVADSREIRLNYIKTFDRHERDKFTTFFFRGGQQVDSSVGRITYSSPHCAWMESTAAHNAIVVDGEDEREQDGVLVASDLAGKCPIALIGTDPKAPLYDGVSQLRGIALIEGAYIVFDRVASDKPRTFDRYQYGVGKAALKFDAKKAAALPHLPKRGAFSGVEGGPCGKELRVDFAGGLKMRLVSDRELAAYKALSVGGYQAGPIEATFARASNATEATFLAAFTLGKDSEPPALRILKSTADAVVLEVGTQAARYTIAVDSPGRKAEVKAGAAQ
ncbi:MAG: hypothetical protein FJ291_02750 [Planctomycetes bacterium]|nr:hypothetical protein [Planctomycetota bacterium]